MKHEPEETPEIEARKLLTLLAILQKRPGESILTFVLRGTKAIEDAKRATDPIIGNTNRLKEE